MPILYLFLNYSARVVGIMVRYTPVQIKQLNSMQQTPKQNMHQSSPSQRFNTMWYRWSTRIQKCILRSIGMLWY